MYVSFYAILSDLPYFLHIFPFSYFSPYRKQPALVAQLGVRPPGDQEVASSTPAGLATFFPGYLILKYILQSVSSFC